MGRRNPPAVSRSLRSWPLLVVVAGVLAGLLVAVVGDSTWRLGGLIIGGSLAVGALLRAVLPGQEAGLMQVRTKGFDLAVLTFCSVAIIVLTISVPSGR